MKKQMQERPSTLFWLLISSVLVLCAQVVGLAAEEDQSILMSDGSGQEVLVAQLLGRTVPGLDTAIVGIGATGARGRNLMADPPTGQAGRVVNLRDLANFYDSIQAAIDDANDGDVVVAESLSTGNTVYSERIDFKGKAITLRSGNILDPNDTRVHPETTFISGNLQDGSVVTFSSGEGRESVIQGFTIGWGVAQYGGGISITDASPTIRDCTITSNQASDYGGGIDCYGGSPQIVNCIIEENEVTGDNAEGAGVNMEDGEAIIADCTIRNNISSNYGGGVSLYGASPTVTNCFVLNNTAGSGAGQFNLNNASPTITNCTIVTDEPETAAGGIEAYGESTPMISNCIIWGNGDDLFNCGASYSCIEDGDPGLGNTSKDPLLIEGPLGLYYLSQVEAGQLETSPCVNSGDPNTAADLAAHLGQLTTRTDGVADVNLVDMGAHYELTEPEMLPLNVQVVTTDAENPTAVGGYADPNTGSFRKYEVVELTAYPYEGYRFVQWLFVSDPGSPLYDTTIAVPVTEAVNLYAIFEKIEMYELVTSVVGAGGDVDPYLRRGELYPAGTVVTLTAQPDPTYIVDQWVGTDDDTLWTNSNTITMDSDKRVTVSFRQRRTFYVNPQQPRILQAIEAAADHGDRIILRAGTYFLHHDPNIADPADPNLAGGIDFGGKAITFSSENPDDPTVVARTIIDCNEAGRAFIFQNGEGRDSVVTGFTIRRGWAIEDPTTATDGATDIAGLGGAIACFGGASPTLTNLVVEDCHANGMTGADGAAPDPASPASPGLDALDPLAAPEDPEDPDDPNAVIEGVDGENGADGAAGADGAPGAPGALGGNGGNGFGGAFYFDPNSSPVITNCTIRNCTAYGGKGGAGGAGQDGGDGQDGQPGQAGQNGGAGINGPGGDAGSGGAGGPGGAGGIGGDGGKGGDGGNGLGGAMYFGENSTPLIRGCTISNCETRQGESNVGGAGGAGGNGGAGGTGGEAGEPGDGDPAGAEGEPGADAAGGAGGAGGLGGSAGINGTTSRGGAIFFDANSVVVMEDTVISDCNVLSDAAITDWAGADGGDGGNGGAGDPAGAGGAGAMGGAGSPAGDGGANGAAGDGSGGGGSAESGAELVSHTTGFGGAIAYGANCQVTLTRCTFRNNDLEVEAAEPGAIDNRDTFTGGGGAEFYTSGCQTEQTGCAFEGNTSEGYGGAQAFEPACTVEITDGSYQDNTSTWNAGAIRLWDGVEATITDTVFSGNAASGKNTYGGALYASAIEDPSFIDWWFNGGMLTIADCTFSDNSATWGGGLGWYGYGAEITMSDCVIQDNTAEDGGGVWFTGGTSTVLRDCSIRDNTAMGGQYSLLGTTGVTDPNDPNIVTTVDTLDLFDTEAGNGGGLTSISASPIIENSFIGDNDVMGAGGGLYFFGESTPMVKNCLIRANTATIGGGGLVAYWAAAPTITNSTIVENIASDSTATDRGKGGGILGSYESQITLKDSIVWDNTAQEGSQIAIGNLYNEGVEAYPASLTVSYSIVENGSAGISVEPGRTLNWLAGNLSDDPLFVNSYYLSQVASGQDTDSPAVNAGSTTAAALGLDDFTTRTDGRDDAGRVDIGFHYAGRGRYQLIVDVIGGNGTVEPQGGYYHEFVEVPLVATPAPGYRVKEWMGTNNDPGWNQNTNSVTMDSDKYVTVVFEPDVTRNLLVPSHFETIEEAIIAASPGDTNIIIDRGVHYITSPEGIDLQGKAIRIMSADPNDPDVVANTIIECLVDEDGRDASGAYARQRAFHFHSGETADCTIVGITIRNAYWVGAIGETGGYVYPNHLDDPNDDGYFTPADQEFDPDRDPRWRNWGLPANADGFGGAILCENGSSPTFKKCVIENCVVAGAQGGDGIDGFPITTPPDTDQPGDWGGNGATGQGDGYGGAVACLGGSTPRFIECTIRNCAARGGMGGDGGNGSNPNEGSGWASHGGAAGDAIGDGHGGAVYCEDGSNALFERCIFINNQASTGEAGEPGAAGPGADLPEEYRGPASNGANGDSITFGTIAGGAIYQRNADPRFVDCQFVENMAFQSFLAYTLVSSAGMQWIDMRIYMPGGGIYSGVGNTVSAEGCRFAGNITSAIYMEGRGVIDVNDCVFSKNQANSYVTYITITNGEVAHEETDESFAFTDYTGGAIYVGPNCTDVTLRDCKFYSNLSSDSGGAVRLESDADLIDCSFSGNRAGQDGGALQIYYDTGDPQNRAILDVNLTRCNFGGNEAVRGLHGWGGAVHAVDFNSVIDDCYFFGNRAKNGGGLFLVAGEVAIKGGIVNSNESIGGTGVDTLSLTSYFIDVSGVAFVLPAASEMLTNGLIGLAGDNGSGVDMGGGLVLATSDAMIEDCKFQNNSAGGASGAGGAIAFYSGYRDHVVKNCLFIDNDTSRDGGAIWAGLAAEPILTNCTFKDNEASRLGGGIYCDWESSFTVTDCIFQGNENLAIAETNFGDAAVSHSLFYENPDGDYGVYDTVSETIDQTGGEALHATNIKADPLFVEGPLGTVYLSQVAAGQGVDSPAVDAGSVLAEAVQLDAMTTRIDGQGDEGPVDMGFHFRDHTDLPLYTLTTEVIDGHGTVSPTGGQYYAGTPVTITATPESGWRVGQWTGTSDDTSVAPENLVVIGPDRYVSVEFDQPRTLVVGSAPEYTSIQRAIDAAEDGDVVAIPAGTYNAVWPWYRISIMGKDITVMGTNPDDPNAVRGTVLRRYQFYLYNVGPGTIIEGISMHNDPNHFWYGGDGAATPAPDDGENGGSIAGGAMFIWNGSPTIRNCSFENIHIEGGDGFNGDGGGGNHPMGYDGGWAGYAYGGAIYMGYLSSPLIQNCSFVNCSATGGDGGNGGAGANGAKGGRGGNWEGGPTTENERIALLWDGWEKGPYMDYWKYSGYGGAVFCEFYSSPTFEDCLFENNATYGGISGIGAAAAPDPCEYYDIENFGGAAYVGFYSDPTFIGCVFRSNFADTNTVDVPDDVYTSYGGAVAFEENCNVSFDRCAFEDNAAAIGGGVYWSRATAMMTDCNLVGNNAYHGGGLYAADSNGVIDRTHVHANLAMKTNPDPNVNPDPNSGYGRIFSWGGGLCAVNSPLNVLNSVFANNRALAAGGGVHLAGSDQDTRVAPLVQNCLIVGNSAGRDGGGISTWKSEPIISNCTVADNMVSGALGTAIGGGLSVAYDSNAVVTNSIFWGNTSTQDGAQISVSNGFEYGPRPSTLNLTFSTVGPQSDPNAMFTGPLDLVFLFDSTESMLTSMTYLKAVSSDLLSMIDENVSDYRIAVADYKDFNDTESTGLGIATDYSYRVVTEFTDDLNRVIGGFNSIGNPAGSGGNLESESVFSGLISAIDGNDLGGWRGGDVKRVILLIGDTPPHDPEPPTGYAMDDVLFAAMKSPSKSIYTVPIGPDPSARLYFTDLAAASGGGVVYAKDPNFVVDAVTECLELITYTAPPVFLSNRSQLGGWDAVTGMWDSVTGNLSDDPLFIAGYYLSQTASGQSEQSPAVDAGSDAAGAIGIDLADRTTRTDGVYDADAVDMGYHYAEGLTLYTLTVEAVSDANDGLPHGTVSPAYAIVYEGSADNVITLEAVPESGYTIREWIGTDDDTSTELTNTVTLTEDRHVRVVFAQRKARVVTVPGDYATIQAAVAAAGEGDTIVVDQGTYTSGFSEFALIIDRAITITSTNPDDPTVVAATIIDGLNAAGNEFNNLGVVFDGESGAAVLNGFTIQNCGGRSVDGLDGDRDEGHPDGYDGGPIHGGAIVMLPGASPTIKNCVLRNNLILAGNGGNGVDADATTNAGRGGWGGWARGGAVYCAANTNPTFINCTIENNFAEGGNGGNGGSYEEDGGAANYGGNYTPPYNFDYPSDGFQGQERTRSLWKVWQWDFALDVEAQLETRAYDSENGVYPSGGSYYGDYRWYSAYGGGVFIDQYSNARFISCVIQGNRTQGGMSGQGGAMSDTGRLQEPLLAFEIPSYGAGVYCAAETTVSFVECTFADNVASETITDPNFRLDPYIGYGGGVAAEGTANISFADCNFVDNEADTGGALFARDAVIRVVDCNIVENTGLRGGGVATMKGTSISILGTDVKRNLASVSLAVDPNDDLVLPTGAGILCLTTSAQIQDCDISDNRSGGSGGGIYLRGENESFITNCLIENNQASRDGGGLSTNWYAEPTVRNCTFVGNTASGTAGDPDKTGLGGGVFSGNFSECTIVDTILWKNRGLLGTELAVGSGFELDPRCGTINILYSDVFVGPNDVWVDEGCALNYGDGIIHLDPIFVDGPLGNRYLNNGAVVGQSRTSPCVDAGSDLAHKVGMTGYTTRTDRVPDTGQVDIGFHYPYFEPCKFCDLVFDGIITFNDFAVFADRWLDAGCSEADGWCGGADLTFDASVDARDLAVLADCWLVQDVTAPLPNPAEWEVTPRKDGGDVRMEAVEAIDGWGWPVQYYFDCLYGNCHDSGWQNSPVYRDKNLPSDEVFGYRVKVRDTSPLFNETKWSEVRFAGTADTLAPTPEPYIENIFGQIATDANGLTVYEISMTSTIAYDDESGGVQYYFQVDDVNTPGGHDSGWLDTNIYTDTELDPDTTYSYRVRARDISNNQNMTDWSDWVSATTPASPDQIAPTPNPAQWDPNGYPAEYYVNFNQANEEVWVEMMAVVATDDTGGPVEYFFECTTSGYGGLYNGGDGTGYSSGWITENYWRVRPDRRNLGLQFRVRVRDEAHNVTGYSEKRIARVLPEQPAVPNRPTTNNNN